MVVVQQPLPQLKLPPKESKRPKRQPGDWKVIAVVFGITVLLSAVFYLRTEAKIIWQKLTTPMVITQGAKPGVKVFDASSVLAEVKSLTANLRGTYGFYVYELTDGNEYGQNQTMVFPAASLIKLPVILTLYKEAEAGRIDLETKYTLKEADKIGGAGFLQNKVAGTTYTYRQLAEFMGHYSDNTAFGIVRKLLGDAKIQSVIDGLGMSKTSLAKNETSPEDVAKLFRQLYEGKVLNEKDKNEVLTFLTKTVFEDWIPAGIPTDIQVAHKIGKDVGTFSDGGIVFGPKPFVLVIMSKDAREEEAVAVLPKISKAVWEFGNKR
jgi:beta-lactamase class A